MHHACSRAIILAVLICRSDFAPADEKPTEIPLKDLWALKMPDTQDATKLDDGQSKPLVEEVRRALRKPRVKSGFVVEGMGRQALINAHAIVTGKAKLNEQLPTNVELSLVFFSQLGGRDIWINRVERSDTLITLKYEAVVQEAGFLNAAFALIPLGKLADGKYEVKFQELATLTPGGLAAPRLKKGIVCEPFSFEVHRR